MSDPAIETWTQWCAADGSFLEECVPAYATAELARATFSSSSTCSLDRREARSMSSLAIDGGAVPSLYRGAHAGSEHDACSVAHTHHHTLDYLPWYVKHVEDVALPLGYIVLVSRPREPRWEVAEERERLDHERAGDEDSIEDTDALFHEREVPFIAGVVHLDPIRNA